MSRSQFGGPLRFFHWARSQFIIISFYRTRVQNLERESAGVQIQRSLSVRWRLCHSIYGGFVNDVTHKGHGSQCFNNFQGHTVRQQKRHKLVSAGPGDSEFCKNRHASKLNHQKQKQSDQVYAAVDYEVETAFQPRHVFKAEIHIIADGRRTDCDNSQLVVNILLRHRRRHLKRKNVNPSRDTSAPCHTDYTLNEKGKFLLFSINADYVITESDSQTGLISDERVSKLVLAYLRLHSKF